jgi:hypothetical protein
MLMEVKFAVKKNTKVFNKICLQNTTSIKDIVTSGPIRFSGKICTSYCTNIKVHMVNDTSVLHRVNVFLQKKKKCRYQQ